MKNIFSFPSCLVAFFVFFLSPHLAFSTPPTLLEADPLEIKPVTNNPNDPKILMPPVRPPLHRSKTTDKHTPHSILVRPEFELDLITFKISENDQVTNWRGKMQHSISYADPIEGTSIIEYWKSWNMYDVIERYLEVKETKHIGSITKDINDRLYHFKFIPHKTLSEISGYILDGTSFDTARSYEVTKQFQQMKTSLFRIFGHLLRNPLHQVSMQIQELQEKISILKATRKQPLISEMGRSVTFDMVVREMRQHIDDLQKYSTNILRIHTLVEDFIAFNDKTVKLHIQPLDLVDVVMSLWKEWKDVAKRKHIDFHLEIEPRNRNQHSSILSDRGRIIKCIVALVENAIQNTPEDGEILFHMELDWNYFTITVADSGIGISSEALYDLNDQMKSGSISLREDGKSGLGISLCLTYRTVVTLMGGTMMIQNIHESPTGSVCSDEKEDLRIPFFQFREGNELGFMVQIRIPFENESVNYFSSKRGLFSKDILKDQSQQWFSKNDNRTNNDIKENINYPDYTERRSSVFTSNVDNDNIPNHTMQILFNGEKLQVSKRDTVLIVDDNAINLKLLEKLLQQSGYKNILKAMDGQEGSILYHDYYQRINIILTDLQMPVSGYELARKIRNFETNSNISPNIPIIAVSASGAEASVLSECLEQGMNDLLTKPLNKAVIQKTMKKWSLE